MGRCLIDIPELNLRLVNLTEALILPIRSKTCYKYIKHDSCLPSLERITKIQCSEGQGTFYCATLIDLSPLSLISFFFFYIAFIFAFNVQWKLESQTSIRGNPDYVMVMRKFYLFMNRVSFKV